MTTALTHIGKKKKLKTLGKWQEFSYVCTYWTK